MIKLIAKIAPLVLKISFIICFALSALLIYNSPPDYQQGDLVKILYIHVPSAWLSLQIYALMTLLSICYLISKKSSLAILSQSITILGLYFTLTALLCGSLWGAKSWGSCWVWDARLTSELILAFIYLALIFTTKLFEDCEKTDLTHAILTIFCSIDLPIIIFSVKWWNSLHQGSSISLTRPNTLDSQNLAILACSFVTFAIFFIICSIYSYKAQSAKRKLKLQEAAQRRLTYKQQLKEEING